ncbi:MAG TPA: ABC transporter substrate-binding protein [Candidatus Limnocylindria bacterium]|nr:ABC transporter substrate-binding protein [Candidatus Limnocylindria bacterium]
MAHRLRFSCIPVLAVLLAACGQGAARPASEAPGSLTVSLGPSAPPSEGTAYPLTLTDDAGREVTIEAEPDAVVSLAPSNTEIVCAVGACDRIVGVNDFRDGFPADVTNALDDVPNVAGFAAVDREAVVDLEPDLILAAGNELTPTADIEALQELGFDVVVLYPESLEEVYADIGLIGEALNRQSEAAEIVADMRERVAAVEEAVEGEERPRTFYEVGVFGGEIYTAGEDSFLAALIDTAGGEPITGDAVTTAIQLEDLVAADPELILLGDAAYDPTITPEAVANRRGWGGMTAVQTDRVIPMPEDILITRPGPRIVEGLAALAAAIHPEAFD